MNILIHDIETLKEMFLLSIFIPDEGKWIDITVNKNMNNIHLLDEMVSKYQDYYWVGYNSLRFDSQVIEWILRNYQYWEDKSWQEICLKIYQKAQDTIDDSNYDVMPVYSEDKISYKQIDLFLIWHYNNKNRMVSLKRLEFEMDFENIEEMPVEHDKINMTDNDIATVISYCHNDIRATHAFYEITLGETDHPLYKGKNKIADRIMIEQELGLKCLNWDDVKIGAEWNRLDYMKKTGRSMDELRPKKVEHFFGKKYRKFFPNTVTFQTRELKRFLYRFGNTFIMNKKQNFEYKFNEELTVNVARGGLHSKEKPRMLIPKENEIYYQCDIGLNCGPIKIPQIDWNTLRALYTLYSSNDYSIVKKTRIGFVYINYIV